MVIYTLEDAIRLHVKKFMDSHEPFSIHDITRKIRNDVNEEVPEYIIPECWTYDQEVDYEYEIDHRDVKRVFHRIKHEWQGLIATTSNSKSYVEYWFSAPINLTITNNTIVGDSINDRLMNYLSNHNGATLHRIQKALKRGGHATGMKVAELCDMAKKLGYSVQQNVPLYKAKVSK